MNRETFVRRYQDDWQELEAHLDDLERRRRRRRQQPQRQRRHADFPELYRRVCQHLALVRSRLYGTDLEERLHRLVLRGHHQLYRGRGLRAAELGKFLAVGFPRAVRRNGKLFAISFALLFGPLFSMAIAVTVWPELVDAVIDPAMVEEFREMYDPAATAGRTAEGDVLMFGVYIYNNISIAFRTFAGGIVYTLGSIFFLVFNGVAIGAISGLMIHLGFSGTFFPFVIGHGSLELVAIVVAGASGLKLGLAVLAPGRQRRGAALLAAARASMELVYGFTAMLVAAAFVEAFWSAADFVPASLKIAVGTLGWIAVAAYLGFAGRRRGA